MLRFLSPELLPRSQPQFLPQCCLLRFPQPLLRWCLRGILLLRRWMRLRFPLLPEALPLLPVLRSQAQLLRFPLQSLQPLPRSPLLQWSLRSQKNSQRRWFLRSRRSRKRSRSRLRLPWFLPQSHRNRSHQSQKSRPPALQPLPLPFSHRPPWWCCCSLLRSQRPLRPRCWRCSGLR